MNKLTKLGVSALCGSLATVSAVSAGEMTVTGSAHMTYTQLGHGETGNPLGMKTNLSFAGSGELDGGQTFSLTIDNTDKNVFSAGNIALTTNNLGTFNMNQAGGGGGVGGYDDNMPRAWEEVWDTGAGGGANLAKGSGSSMHIGWVSPTFAGVTVKAAYTPDVGSGAQNDKTVGGGVGHIGRGYDIVLDMNPSLGLDVLSGLNVFVGYHNGERDDGGGNSTYTGAQKIKDDHEEGVAGVSFALGPVKVGLQRSFEHTANQVAGQTNFYANTSWGVSFNVNDNLSMSYGYFQSDKGFVNPGANADVELEGNSFQVAYTMGGASLKFADTEIDNASYTTTAAAQKTGTTLALALAF